MDRCLKILDDIRIASPCHASLDAMTGDDRVRQCRSCGRTVYSLSALSAEKAAELIVAREGQICIRMHRRHDGTVITQDCPVGRSARLRKRIRAAIISVASWLGFLPFSGCTTSTSTTSTMGEICPPKTSNDSAAKSDAKSSGSGPTWVMGDMAMPVPSFVKDPNPNK